MGRKRTRAPVSPFMERVFGLSGNPIFCGLNHGRIPAKFIALVLHSPADVLLRPVKKVGTLKLP